MAMQSAKGQRAIFSALSVRRPGKMAQPAFHWFPSLAGHNTLPQTVLVTIRFRCRPERLLGSYR